MPDSYEFTDEDLREALKEMGSYVDVTEEDLKKIYSLALKHARQRLAASVAVADTMTPKVVAVGKDDDISTAIRLLSENRISGLPVVDDDGLVIGVVSEADILGAAGMESGFTFKDIIRKLLGEPLAGHKKGAKVGDIMSEPAITISGGADIGEAAKILSERRIKRLPVVDNDGRLVGIISRADIVKAAQQR
jgi:CBS domain-containing membrane protein